VAIKRFPFLSGISLFMAMLIAALLYGQSSEACMMCHGNASLSKSKQGRRYPFLSIRLASDHQRMLPSPVLVAIRVDPGAMPHAKDN